MKYRILESGHIEITEDSGVGFAVAPNEPLEKHNEVIEADENFVLYRTKENADAYEARLKELEPTASEIQAQKERDAEDEARRIAIEELIAERTKTALDNVKSEIAKGKIENARKAVRDEHKKLKG